MARLAEPSPTGSFVPVEPRLSRHAKRRCRERVIPEIVVEWLFYFGLRLEAPGRAWRHVFGKKGWSSFRRHLGPQAKHFEKYRRAYLIVSSDDEVITAAWEH